MSPSSRRRFPSHPLIPSAVPYRAPAAVACLLALAGCSSGDQTGSVAVPRPPAAEAALCRALHRALPEKVDGQTRRATRPVSDLTAAWGSPAIVLRCGVPRPDVLTPGNAQYNPSADSVDINGVDWLPQKLSGGGVRCVTTLRKAFVEVTIPRKYAGPYGDLSGLTDLASAISGTVPEGLV